MLLLYNVFLFLYISSVRILALFNPKAKKWIAGRSDWEHRVHNTLSHGGQQIWVHCSSVGEFEQARPLVEALRREYAGYKILLTFFSPSGYEACKNSSIADYVFYLPHDGAAHSRKFIDATAPVLAIFVKYEFWYYYLRELKNRNIPTLLVSGAFREGQPFFKAYGTLFRKMLSCFSYFFVQDEESARLLHSVGFSGNVEVAGDTRYDRVSAISQNFSPIGAIERFKGDHKLLIAGSTWPGDEAVLHDCLPLLPLDWKLVIVPHEIDEAHITGIRALFGSDTTLYTELDANHEATDSRVLIVNNMGMLSRIFYYGGFAYIGGGFQKGGIHNVLEPAVFGLPVVVGPIYEKFVEAKELVQQGYVFPVTDSRECGAVFEKLVADAAYRQKLAAGIKAFMEQHIGATALIMNEVRRQNWLDRTNPL